jgi:hypothetical protein
VEEGGAERGAAKGVRISRRSGHHQREGMAPGREGFSPRRSREGRGANPSRRASRIQPSKAMSGPNDESFPETEKDPALADREKDERRILVGARPREPRDPGCIGEGSSGGGALLWPAVPPNPPARSGPESVPPAPAPTPVHPSIGPSGTRIAKRGHALAERSPVSQRPAQHPRLPHVVALVEGDEVESSPPRHPAPERWRPTGE